MKDSTLKLQKKININFKNIKLLEMSLIHKSFNHIDNNEKLEFLGDRVLGLVLSKNLLDMYPNEKEGSIDKKLANLVNKKTCFLVSQKIDLKSYVKTSDSYKHSNTSDSKIASDALEALIGAIYLDQGLKESEIFILKYWSEFLKNSLITLIDCKTQLQEYSLKKFKCLPIYKSHKQSGPKHKPIFKVEVQITESKKYFANGPSIKIAQQNAAKKLIADLKI